MNKRTFIKLLSATVAGPVVSRLLAWVPEDKLKNWAGNFEYSTEDLYSANSLEQVREFVKKQSQLKVLGTRHCFNRIADSKQHFLSFQRLRDQLRAGALRENEISALEAHAPLFADLDVAAWG